MTYLALAVLALVVIVILAKLRSGEEPRDPHAPPPSPAEVQRLITAGKTIEAVKAYRLITGLGLYDAKQAVDRMRATGAWEAPASTPSIPGDEAVMALVRENKLIEAIKVYRELHGGDLAAAKQAVDRLASNR